MTNDVNLRKETEFHKRKYSGKPVGFKCLLIENNRESQIIRVRTKMDGNLEILDSVDNDYYSVRDATLMEMTLIQEAILKGKENDHV